MSRAAAALGAAALAVPAVAAAVVLSAPAAVRVASWLAADAALAHLLPSAEEIP